MKRQKTKYFVRGLIFFFFALTARPVLANAFSLPWFCAIDARIDTIKNNREGKRIFIETGTAGGGGLFIAMHAGFTELYSVELDSNLHQMSKERVGNNPNVHLYQGDSAQTLWTILAQIHEPSLFWLDAHFWDKAPGLNCPILKELEAIAAHPIKTHTILVDDVRCFGTAYYDHIPIEAVVDAIRRINPDYEITFQDGYVKNDVLVAKIPEKCSS